MSGPALQPIAAASGNGPAITRVQLIRGAAFVAAHIPLAVMLRAAPWMSTLHAIATVLICLLIAASGRIAYSAVAICYIAGAEVLWRMTKAGVFWEYGKYATCMVVLVGMLRIRGSRHRRLALGYLLLLLPSVALTFLKTDLDNARQQVSFNLSGPLTLALCAIFLSNIKLTQSDLRRAFVAALGPIMSIATISYVSTRSFDVIAFGNESNYRTTGGFGPNQVSAVLGLGVLFAILFLFERKLRMGVRILLILVAAGFGVLSALTFSRGGLLMTGFSIFLATLYLLRDRKTRVSVLVVGALLFAFGKFVAEPRLEAFTGGELSQRFSNTGSTGRDKFIAMDLKIFSDNVLIGVGPGMADPIREQMGFFAISHTEYSRLLAEHGLLGAGALVLLVLLGYRTIRDTRDVRARAFTVALIAWTAFFLGIYAMRLAAPCVVFGLASAISNSSLAGRR
jgi:O-antigen ligase